MFSALSRGESHIRGLSQGEDVLSTASCLRALGVRIEHVGGETVVQADGLSAPRDTLNAGNSGTTIRLLSGILAGQAFESVIGGDASLRRRPMGRVIAPLQEMGARIESAEGKAPLRIQGGGLRAIRYRSPVASAQVKSCVLLAGLFAHGETVVLEPSLSRDHTERMLAAQGVPVQYGNGEIRILPRRPNPLDLTVPGDMSSAAFLFGAAVLTGGAVTVQGVGVNPTRTGILSVLERLGARVDVREERLEGGEPVADVTVSGSIQHPICIGAEEVPGVIDELPLIALLATQARGVSTIRGAKELRVKESDRIATVTGALNALGASVAERADGFVITGPTPLSGTVLSGSGDHRVAMMGAVAGTVASGETMVEGAEVAAVSFPLFLATLAGLGAQIEE